MNDFMNRIIRAIKLDGTLYSEVKVDKQALGQAMAVVALSGLASGVGTAKGLIGYLVTMSFTIALWLGWSFIVYLVGTRLLPEPQTQRDYPGLLRATGFAYAPHILQVLAAFPNLIVYVTIVTTIWTLAAIVVSVRQAFDYQTTFRAIWVVVISVVVQAVILFMLASIFSTGTVRPV